MTKLDVATKPCEHGNTGHCKRCEEAKQAKAAPVAKPAPKVEAPAPVVPPAPMTDADLTKLAELEEVIEAGIAKFVEVGTALAEVRSERLYRAEYKTFEDYCRDRWSFGRQRAAQLIEAADVSKTFGQTLKVESHARELAPLKADPEAMREALEEASAKGKPTAAKVREAVNKRLPGAVRTPSEPKPSKPEPFCIDPAEAILVADGDADAVARFRASVDKLR
jgi:hypothetical protein